MNQKNLSKNDQQQDSMNLVYSFDTNSLTNITKDTSYNENHTITRIHLNNKVTSPTASQTNHTKSIIVESKLPVPLKPLHDINNTTRESSNSFNDTNLSVFQNLQRQIIPDTNPDNYRISERFENNRKFLCISLIYNKKF